jgi:hypothetical protein
MERQRQHHATWPATVRGANSNESINRAETTKNGGGISNRKTASAGIFILPCLALPCLAPFRMYVQYSTKYCTVRSHNDEGREQQALFVYSRTAYE